MVRHIALLAIVGLASLSGGCRMCCSDYDYCGPVYDHGGNDFFYRKNSVLGGDNYGGPIEGEYIEGQPVDGQIIEGPVYDGEVREGVTQPPLKPIPEPMRPQSRRGMPTLAR